MKKVLLLTIMLLILGTSVFAWDLVYSHDKDGRALSGSLSYLIDAVKNGRDIRVVIDRTAVGCGLNALIPTHLSYNHSRMYGTLQTVSAGFGNPAYYTCWQFDSYGTVFLDRFNVSGGASRGQSTEKCPISWYVNY